MAHVITFSSGKFDAASETPNPINPIARESLLRWLRERLREGRYDASEPETLQIHKQRSLRDKITGKNKLTVDDPLSALIERLVRQDAEAMGVEVARDA